MPNQNPNCDGAHCSRPDGEVRTLPTGGDGNAILCHACYVHELRWRQERNRELGTAAQFPLTPWADLAVYGE